MTERLDLLFFELASEDRLNILREVNKNSLKMQDVARKLDLTATEASRQLQRMARANLVRKAPDGSYATTCYGKALLVLSSSLDFLFKNKEYFTERDVLRLPLQFVYRLGELSEGQLFTELNEVMLRWEELIKAGEERLWVMIPQAMPSLSQLARQRMLQGVKIKAINNEQLSETSLKYMLTGKDIERRCFPEVPVYILMTEKEASICIPLSGQQMDVATFFGKDPSFMKWVNDLYLYYWEQAKSWYSS